MVCILARNGHPRPIPAKNIDRVEVSDKDKVIRSKVIPSNCFFLFFCTCIGMGLYMWCACTEVILICMGDFEKNAAAENNMHGETNRSVACN